MKKDVIVFGGGNFVRGFLGYMFTKMKNEGLWDGKMAVIKPTRSKSRDYLKEQGFKNTLIIRGGAGEELFPVNCFTESINPYENYNEFLKLAENPDLKVVLSNTTEEGLTLCEEDMMQEGCPTSYPAKLLELLYQRYKHFNGNAEAGVYILPMELVSKNADKLKELLLAWNGKKGYGEDFERWLSDSCVLINNLVDRTVTGYPYGEEEKYKELLGFDDKLLCVCDEYYKWYIECGEEIFDVLPLSRANLSVELCSDVTKYERIKVRILNASHTAVVPAALLSGIKTVSEMANHETYGEILRKVIFDELLVSEGKTPEAEKFCTDVINRFKNQNIVHNLNSIMLNCGAKYKIRVAPALKEYYERTKKYPPMICKTTAAFIYYYKVAEIEDGKLSFSGYIISDDTTLTKKSRELSDKEYVSFAADYLIEGCTQDLKKIIYENYVRLCEESK